MGRRDAGDPLERDFRQRHRRRLKKTIFEASTMFVAIAGTVIALAATTLAPHPGIARAFQVAGVLSVIWALVCRRFLTARPATLLACSLIYEMSLNAFMCWLVRFDLSHGYIGASASALTVAVTSMYLIGFSQGGTRWAWLQVGAIATMLTITTLPWLSDAFTYVVTATVAASVVAVYRSILMGWVEQEGLSELTRLKSLVPGSVVRRLGATIAPVEEVFEATPRPCVCLSSDWRGYQKLSATLAPEELARTLGEYYAMCDRLLAAAAPEGDYYFDWIADELFVVFFDLSVEGGAGAQLDLAARALAFADALIRAKVGFAEDHPAPAAIDIGIGAGTALIGMLGAPGMSKVTAAGPMQARVREMQNQAKALRKQLGDQDRIVFGADLLRAAPGAALIPGSADLYYLQPVAAARAA